MKRLMTLMIVAMISVISFAQNDVTKFLGIPVDGTVEEMKAKLIQKGFKEDNGGLGNLIGRFNGKDVNVFIVENKGKVYRIMVSDQRAVGETDIRIQFNNLYSQFLNNNKYLPVNQDTSYMIPSTEDISYEMTVNNKRYEADFYQSNTDTTYIRRCIIETALAKYGKEQVMTLSKEQWDNLMPLVLEREMNDLQKRIVWFMISGAFGRYYLTIFYDNCYNMANGEDL